MSAPAYLRILRPANCIMMGAAVLVGSVLEGGVGVLESSLPSLLVGFLAGFALTASSMVLNDYADRDIDMINEPARPIPSGLIKPRAALVYGLFLAIIGLILAALLGSTSLYVGGFAWILFLAYTLRGKRIGFLGNVLVSLCVAVPFLYGAAILGYAIGSRILIFALIAFLANLGREVNKGIVDIQGDQAKKVRTIAAKYGAGPAAKLAALLYLSAVVLSALPILWQMVSILYYLPFVLITDLGFCFGALSILRNSSRENARSQKRLALLWMLFGLLAFLIGSST